MESLQEKAKLSLMNEDFDQFRNWLNLNLEAVTWQGRYQQEFEEFWNIFFIEGLSLDELSERFDYALQIANIGPLSSWFVWLRDKLLCYVFINKEVTILELSRYSKLEASDVATMLRGFFLDHYPHLDDQLSESFQLGNITNQSAQLTFKKLHEKLGVEKVKKGSHEDEIMTSMEVTLYDEWGYFIRKMRKEIKSEKFNIHKIKKRMTFEKQVKFFKEVVLLMVIGGLLVLGIRQGNLMYEKFLVDKISIYEPQFQWLDKTLTFKSTEEALAEDFALDIDDIDEMVDVAGDFGIVQEEERFDTESEVVLTSWDSLPRDFNVANLEVSSFEELENRGYRDTRYGNTKVYRVLMKSVDTLDVRDKLDTLLRNYQVTQVDNVRPGQHVPGGIYYNLYVPMNRLKEFIAQVMEVDESILYESRTRAGRNPPGQNKVFIWVKSI